MSTNTSKAALEFAGFLDGFKARNLANVYRVVDRHISEFQSWIAVMRSHLDSAQEKDAEVIRMLDGVSAQFRNTEGNIVDHTESATKILSELLIRNAQEIRAREILAQDCKGIIRALIETAEDSHSDRITRSVLELADNYKRVVGEKQLAHA